MQEKGDRNHRSRVMPVSYLYAGEDIAKIFRVENVGYMKGKSSLIISEKHANSKYKYGNQHCRYRRKKYSCN